MNTPLTNQQRRALKALAQRLDPAMHVGKAGVTETFIAALSEALAARELIKIKFTALQEQRKELSAEIAARTDSHLVWIVGHVAVFYRTQPDPARRRVSLDR